MEGKNIWKSQDYIEQVQSKLAYISSFSSNLKHISGILNSADALSRLTLSRSVETYPKISAIETVDDLVLHIARAQKEDADLVKLVALPDKDKPLLRDRLNFRYETRKVEGLDLLYDLSGSFVMP